MKSILFNTIARPISPHQMTGIKIAAPATGQVTVIDDPILYGFGAGAKIQIEKPTVISPIKGIVIEVAPGHGKIVLKTKNNLRFLIQLPSEYLDHHGIGIQCHVHIGQHVERSCPLLTLDLYKIQLQLKPVVLYFSLLDTTPFKLVGLPYKHVTAGQDPILCLIPKKKTL